MILPMLKGMGSIMCIVMKLQLPLYIAYDAVAWEKNVIFYKEHPKLKQFQQLIACYDKPSRNFLSFAFIASNVILLE